MDSQGVMFNHLYHLHLLSRWKPLIPRLTRELITPFTGEPGPRQPHAFISLAGLGHFRNMSTGRVRGRKRGLGTNLRQKLWVPPLPVIPWSTGPQFFQGVDLPPPWQQTSISLSQWFSRGWNHSPKRRFSGICEVLVVTWLGDASGA